MITYILAGERFGNYILREDTQIEYVKIKGGYIARAAGFSEFGEDREEALQNLKWFIIDSLPNKVVKRRRSELDKLFGYLEVE